METADIMELKMNQSLREKISNIVKVLIVDDHPIVYEGLKCLINKEDDMEVCGYSESVNCAIANIEKNNPDLVVVDIGLKGGSNGIDLVKSIKNDYPGIQTIVLSMYDENIYAERVIRVGARGYLMKEEMRGAIIKAIRQVINGKIYLSEKMVSKFFDNFLYDQPDKVGSSIEKLTNRELMVFQLIGEGCKSSEIASKLNISVKTIGTHLFRIQKKLSIKGNARLVKYAIEWAHMN